MSTDAENIMKTKEYLWASPLPEDTKDNLQRLLDAALNASRSKDISDMSLALAQAVAALAIHEVKQAVRAPNAIQSAINRHVEDLHKQCLQLPKTRTEIFVYLLGKPWPWVTIAIGVFSPHAASIIQVIGSLFGGK